jgi:ribonuclease HI
MSAPLPPQGDHLPYPCRVPANVKRATTVAGRASEPVMEVWTDGACSGNPGPGGWAWATRDGRQASGGDRHTTNQRMEIHAALEAVRALDGPLIVVSDSTYVVNCFRDAWWRGWLSRGWVNSAKKPVANRDLWEPLVTAVRDRGDVTFRWIKGHSGDPMNDLVDRLAVDAGRAARLGPSIAPPV